MTPDSVAHSLIGTIEAQGFWLDDPDHRAALKANAGRQLAFFERSKSHGAGASAKQAGHRDADRLIADASEALEKHFWDSAVGLDHHYGHQICPVER